MTDPLFSMALFTGLLGSGHCLGMCGGLVAAFSLPLSGDRQRGGLPFHLLYNTGRITTYTLIGLAVGWLGSAIAYAEAFATFARIILLCSDLFIILIGLGSAGIFRSFNLLSLECASPVRVLTVAVRGLRRLPPAVAALPLGLLFGFIPCGFLYAVAITAAQSAAPLQGAQIMLAFGLGTAPALLLFGTAAHWLGARARHWMLLGAGVMVALMGAWNLFRHLQMMGVW
ncbi:MAG TPA: sulfite exporter TauE/SafE family protein [Desulfuromonadales bacterium]|nr:sulfite exporter TauE/SafE family protein [Desulfuromonadales bacterium]